MKLNASNCHLLRMNSIRAFSRTLRTFYAVHYGLSIDGCFYTYRSTCFSEHLKVDALFIKQQSYFLVGIFLFKESSKKHIPWFSLPWGEKVSSLFLSCFHHYFLCRHSSKPFLYWQSIKILTSLRRYFQC